MEKCVYDSVQSYQGRDPNKHRPQHTGASFPSGGSALPSFSLVPVNKNFGGWGIPGLSTPKAAAKTK